MTAFVGSNAVHKAAFAEWMATGRKDAFKSANLSADDLLKLGLQVGQRFPYKGHVYRAVRARGAVTGEGYLLKQFGRDASREGTAQATHSRLQIVTQETFTKGDLVGARVFIDSGTGIGALREIIENNTNTVVFAQKIPGLPQVAATDSPDALAAVTDGTSTYSIVADWEVVHTSAATSKVVAVALGAVDSGNYTIVMEQGPHALIRCDGDNAGRGLVADAFIVPSATAGVAEGATEAGITAADLAVAFATTYDAYTGSGAARHCRLLGRFAC